MKDRKLKFPMSGTDKGRIECRLARAARHDRNIRRDLAKQADLTLQEVRHAPRHS